MSHHGFPNTHRELPRVGEAHCTLGEMLAKILANAETPPDFIFQSPPMLLIGTITKLKKAHAPFSMQGAHGLLELSLVDGNETLMPDYEPSPLVTLQLSARCVQAATIRNQMNRTMWHALVSAANWRHNWEEISPAVPPLYRFIRELPRLLALSLTDPSDAPPPASPAS